MLIKLYHSITILSIISIIFPIFPIHFFYTFPIIFFTKVIIKKFILTSITQIIIIEQNNFIEIGDLRRK